MKKASIKRDVDVANAEAQKAGEMELKIRNIGIADKEVEELGDAKGDTSMGTVPVGMWSDVAADGDEACTYDMDLYFDGQAVAELQKIAAGEAKDGLRHWYHAWDAQFTGNHHFEMYRYRTCADAKRERIGIAGIEAILY